MHDPEPAGGRPTVTLVITTHDRPAMLDEALTSAHAVDQVGFDLEVLVVDDGSTRATADVLRRYPVRAVQSHGRGVQAARDLGLREASGSFVMFLDDDDVLLPAAIGAQLATFREHPALGAVHGQYELVDSNLRQLGVTVPTPPLSSGLILHDLLAYPPQIATVLTRVEVARAAGPFDPSLPGGEDWDWILRVASRHQVARIPVKTMHFRRRSEPEERLEWERFPALTTIFLRHIHHLPLIDRFRLLPKLWRQRGYFAWRFVEYAAQNWQAGSRDRALRSLAYAIRCSPPHALVAVVRRVLQP